MYKNYCRRILVGSALVGVGCEGEPVSYLSVISTFFVYANWFPNLYPIYSVLEFPAFHILADTWYWHTTNFLIIYWVFHGISLWIQLAFHWFLTDDHISSFYWLILNWFKLMCLIDMLKSNFRMKLNIIYFNVKPILYSWNDPNLVTVYYPWLSFLYLAWFSLLICVCLCYFLNWVWFKYNLTWVSGV